ncbi:MAG: alpha/beta fold hydrolase BchO [Pseudomonadota bacterium]
MMDWLANRDTWPNGAASDFFTSEDVRLHFQRMGTVGSPRLLLLHGSGATTHSFRDLLPLLAQRFDVLAPDLPGHGFSSPFARRVPAMEAVAGALAELLRHTGFVPDLTVGHSAGAAVGVRLAQELSWQTPLVSINGAFYPFPGMAAYIFPAAARLLFLNPFAPRLFAFGAASRSRVEDLIASTGSVLDDQGIDLYQRALCSRHHIEGTLEMMAHWDLTTMSTRLRRLDSPVLQIIGMKDGTIDPAAADDTAALLKLGEMVRIADAGHLVHEEQPDRVSNIISEFHLKHANGTASAQPVDG